MTPPHFLQPLKIPDTNTRMRMQKSGVRWVQSYNMDYQIAVDYMTDTAVKIRCENAPECVWFVEHPPLYTGGTSANDSDLINPALPIYKTGRGGQYTYHGTGQRTIYVMLDLEKRKLGIREFVRCLEQWIIDVLAKFDTKGDRRCGRVGIWINLGDGYEDKICAIGVRVKRWVSFHGIALNINPNLDFYNHIIPCGISDNKFGVTSFEKLGLSTDISHIDTVLVNTFLDVFFSHT